MLSPNRRVLLALEGRGVSRDVLNTAFAQCVRLTSRLDILVSSPPREPASLLGLLLVKLEHSGVDYRLLHAHGSLAEEVSRYLKRYTNRSTVIVIELDALADSLGAKFVQFCTEGHSFMELAG